MRKTCLTALALGVALSGLAEAKPPVEVLRNCVQAPPPDMIAKVKRVDGKYVLDGDWMPYSGGMSTRAAVIDTPFFDCYGRKPGTAGGDGMPGTLCAVNTASCTNGAVDDGSRWNFGSGYHAPNVIEDMQHLACPPSTVVDEIDWGWRWQTTGPCIVVWYFYENVLQFDTGTFQCQDPATFTQTAGGGIAIGWVSLAANAPNSFYAYQATGLAELGMLTPSGVLSGLDAKGFASGSYHAMIAKSFGVSGPELAPGPTQFMLWGTGDSTNEAFRPGFNNEDTYSDDGCLPFPQTAPNNVFELCECYDFTSGGGCDEPPPPVVPIPYPDPNFGMMACFGYLRCPADFNNDGYIDPLDYNWFINAFELGERTADFNGDCFVDPIDYNLFINQFESPCP